jgi:hypothetical protein
MRAPLSHARKKALALVLTQIRPAGAEVPLHAPLPAPLHALAHVRAPTWTPREHRKADSNQKQGPEQLHPRGVDEAEVLEHPEYADGDESERDYAHGYLQE